MIVLIIAGFLLLSSIDLVSLYRHKKWKEILAHNLIMLAALSLLLAELYGLDYPNPTKVIENLYQPINPLH